MRGKQPIAVLISDIHFTVPTLECAAQSLLKAQFNAKMLGVPLIIAGDTLDSKAVMRAECVNKLLSLMSVEDATQTYILVGNHDLCNEKGTEHALNFLYGWNSSVTVVDRPMQVNLGDMDALLIPYQSDLDNLKTLLKDPENPRLLIMHQGLMGAQMGHYLVDKTSLPKEVFADYRVISGHYHRAQDIKCGRPRQGAVGLFSYIGNPYTLSFSEANDGTKGYQILYSDGLMEQVPLDIRKHVIHDVHVDHWWEIGKQNPSDILWIKIRGAKSELDKIKKSQVGEIIGSLNFKLDLIPDSAEAQKIETEKLTDTQVLDTLIEQLNETGHQKDVLKNLYRELLNG